MTFYTLMFIYCAEALSRKSIPKHDLDLLPCWGIILFFFFSTLNLFCTAWCVVVVKLHCNLQVVGYSEFVWKDWGIEPNIERSGWSWIVWVAIRNREFWHQHPLPGPPSGLRDPLSSTQFCLSHVADVNHALVSKTYTHFLLSINWKIYQLWAARFRKKKPTQDQVKKNIMLCSFVKPTWSDICPSKIRD